LNSKTLAGATLRSTHEPWDEKASAWTPTEVKCLAKACGSLFESGTSNDFEVSPGEVSGMSKTERNAANEAAQLQLFAAKSLGDDGVALLKGCNPEASEFGVFPFTLGLGRNHGVGILVAAEVISEDAPDTTGAGELVPGRRWG